MRDIIMMRESIINSDNRDSADTNSLVFEHHHSGFSETRPYRLSICPMVMVTPNGKDAITRSQVNQGRKVERPGSSALGPFTDHKIACEKHDIRASACEPAS